MHFLNKRFGISLPVWAVVFPVVAGLSLLFKQQMPASGMAALFTVAILISAVFSGVHHAEVISHKIGEPFGTLVLALAITVIEVSLIISLMLSEPGNEPSSLARDTVFAAVMIILTGIVGICLFIGGMRYREQSFVKQGINAALITLIAICVLTMVLPNYTTSAPGSRYSNSQLLFVACVTLVLYLGFIVVQALRHREYFVSSKAKAQVHQNLIEKEAKEPPISLLTTLASLCLLFISLTAVVLLSKKLSPFIEKIVEDAGAPKALVGVIIAAVILMPEGLAAIMAARRNNLQTSMNLALGSALASIGLTIPAVAIVCFVTGMEINLGIDTKSMILMAVSVYIIGISFSSGKTNIQQGIVLLVLFATYLFITIVP